MANPVLYTEPGYNGQLVSLAGIMGGPGKGRVVASSAFILAGNIQVMSPNPKRISALILNGDPSINVNVFLGGTSGYAVVLGPLGSFQIDVNFPWTGEVDASPASGTPTISVNEVSVI